MPAPTPILDNHFHVQRHGRFLDAVREFAHHGGTHVTLIPIPGRERKSTRAQWRNFFEEHLGAADEIERSTPVRVVRAVGPYPIEFVQHAEAVGVAQASAAFWHGYEAALDLVREGRAHVLGEVGRAHFPVPAEVQAELNRLLEAGLHEAAQARVATILHTEHATVETFADLASIARRAGFPLDKLVKHYSPPAVLPGENHGLYPSMIASRSNVAAAIPKGDRFLLETDYIDEPTRPNVVLPPYSVPKRTKAMTQQGVPADSLLRIHQEGPERLYDVRIEPGKPVR